MFLFYFGYFIVRLATLRTIQESQNIFEDGYQFLKLYKNLTAMSLRLGCLKQLTELDKHTFLPTVSHARLRLQEWFLKPKCHASLTALFVLAFPLNGHGVQTTTGVTIQLNVIESALV